VIAARAPAAADWIDEAYAACHAEHLAADALPLAEAKAAHDAADAKLKAALAAGGAP
jgi:hypothetical protein